MAVRVETARAEGNSDKSSQVQIGEVLFFLGGLGGFLPNVSWVQQRKRGSEPGAELALLLS